jgi:hypothetical protein
MSKSIVFEPKFRLGKGEHYCTQKEAIEQHEVGLYGLHAISPEMRKAYMESLLFPISKRKKSKSAPQEVIIVNPSPPRVVREKSKKAQQKHEMKQSKKEMRKGVMEASQTLTAKRSENIEREQSDINRNEAAIRNKIRELEGEGDPNHQIPALFKELSDLTEQYEKLIEHKESNIPTETRLLPKPEQLRRWRKYVAEHKGERIAGEKWQTFLKRLAKNFPNAH